LNPHFRHGKPAGYRYIMGANVLIELSKNELRFLRREWALPDKGVCTPERKSTGWDSNPRFRITGAESLPLNDQCV
jgi:hypothetical protein